MKIKTIIFTMLMTIASFAHAQSNDSCKEAGSVFQLPLFERAICCIKYYEGIHRKKDYPYVGYGHRLRNGENYSSNMSLSDAESLLRKDLAKLCAKFRQYGKDSLLLAALAYNVGPYRILGSNGRYEKSTLLKKLEAGIRDIKNDYVQYCHWNGRKIASIERRRYAELMLLYEQ